MDSSKLLKKLHIDMVGENFEDSKKVLPEHRCNACGEFFDRASKLQLHTRNCEFRFKNTRRVSTRRSSVTSSQSSSLSQSLPKTRKNKIVTPKNLQIEMVGFTQKRLSESPAREPHPKFRRVSNDNIQIPKELRVDMIGFEQKSQNIEKQQNLTPKKYVCSFCKTSFGRESKLNSHYNFCQYIDTQSNSAASSLSQKTCEKSSPDKKKKNKYPEQNSVSGSENSELIIKTKIIPDDYKLSGNLKTNSIKRIIDVRLKDYKPTVWFDQKLNQQIFKKFTFYRSNEIPYSLWKEDLPFFKVFLENLKEADKEIKFAKFNEIDNKVNLEPYQILRNGKCVYWQFRVELKEKSGNNQIDFPWVRLRKFESLSEIQRFFLERFIGFDVDYISCGKNFESNSGENDIGSELITDLKDAKNFDKIVNCS